MYYAAFGIFTNNSVMYREAEPVCAGVVHGWRLAWRGCADSERASGDRLWVMVWKIDRTILRKLDRVEGYPYHYTRVVVPVHLPTGAILKAQMYTMVTKGYYSEPNTGMLRTVHVGHLENGLDDSQLERAIDVAREWSHERI